MVNLILGVLQKEKHSFLFLNRRRPTPWQNLPAALTPLAAAQVPHLDFAQILVRMPPNIPVCMIAVHTNSTMAVLS